MYRQNNFSNIPLLNIIRDFFPLFRKNEKSSGTPGKEICERFVLLVQRGFQKGALLGNY